MFTGISDAQRNQIHDELAAGRKIEAIKIYREITGHGLAEAKSAIETMEAELRESSPDRFAAASLKSGCLSMPLLLIAPAALAWLCLH